MGVCWALGLFCLLTPQTYAGVTDVTQLKCAQVFPQGTRNISNQDLQKFMIVVFWLNGYEAGAKRSTLVDITRVQEIANALLSACEKNPDKTCYELLQQYDKQRQSNLQSPASDKAQSNLGSSLPSTNGQSGQAQSQSMQPN